MTQVAQRRVHVAVSEANLRKAAVRLLGQTLVSPEVEYLQRTLTEPVTQQELDAKILAVRKLPWAKVVAGQK